MIEESAAYSMCVKMAMPTANDPLGASWPIRRTQLERGDHLCRLLTPLHVTLLHPEPSRKGELRTKVRLARDATLTEQILELPLVALVEIQLLFVAGLLLLQARKSMLLRYVGVAQRLYQLLVTHVP